METRLIKAFYVDSNFVLGNATAPPDYPIGKLSLIYSSCTEFSKACIKYIKYGMWGEGWGGNKRDSLWTHRV